MSEVNRREYMGTLAALAAAAREEDGYQLEDVEPPDGPLDGGNIYTGRADPDRLRMSTDGPLGGSYLDDELLADRYLGVFFDRANVLLEIEANDKDGQIHAGALASLSPEQAKDLAVALFRAAEEHERRRPDGS